MPDSFQEVYESTLQVVMTLPELLRTTLQAMPTLEVTRYGPLD